MMLNTLSKGCVLGAAVILLTGACSSGSSTEDEAVTSQGLEHTGTLIEARSTERETLYFLSINRKLVKLELDGPLEIKPNTQVRVVGPLDRENDVIDVTSIEPVQAATSEGVGQKQQAYSLNAPAGSIALMLIKDDALAADPFTHAEVLEELTTGDRSAHAYFQEASFGQYGLTADLFGWYTMDVDGCNVHQIGSDIEAIAAAQDGYDHTNYRHVGFLIRRAGEQQCLGGLGNYGFPDGYGLSWYGYNAGGLYAHEIGHNFGMGHASGLICRDHQGGFLSYTGQCNTNEYHDLHDTMGWDSRMGHFSAHRKYLLGWLEPENTHEVVTSGQYTVTPQEEASTGIQNLLIPIVDPTGEGAHSVVFSVEVRKDFGFDAGYAQTVLLRTVSYNSIFNDTHLIDLSPDSHADPIENQLHSSMSVGQTFHDQTTGTSITLVGFNGEDAVIDVQLGGESCSDGTQNGDETDVDCGGPCSPCADGNSCNEHWDCQDYSCESGTCVDADAGGLKAEYYSNDSFSGTPTTVIEPTVDADYFWSRPWQVNDVDNFSIRFSGQVVPRHSETYTFTTTTDDVSRLWVNGVQLIDDSYGTFSGTIDLAADVPVSIEMEFIEYGGEANLQLRWSSSSQVEEVIPRSRLIPATSGCSAEVAISLGLQGESNTVPSDACVKVSQYPAWFQYNGGNVALQTGATGSFPLNLSYTDACTGNSGNVTFTQSWQQKSLGHHNLGCATVIQLLGDGSPVTLRWYP